MNKAKLLNIILLFLFTFYGVDAMGQSFTLQGKVSDQEGNPIELASVIVASQGKMVMSNLKGEFSMQLQSEDSVKIRFSMLGYKAKCACYIALKANKRCRFSLQATMNCKRL